MQHAGLVRGLQRTADADRHLQRLVDRQRAALLETLAVVRVVQLHHDARAAVGGEGVVEDGDDVRMVRQLAERVALPLERATASASEENPALSTLIATSRFIELWRARYTTENPPAPISSITS